MQEVDLSRKSIVVSQYKKKVGIQTSLSLVDNFKKLGWKDTIVVEINIHAF